MHPTRGEHDIPTAPPAGRSPPSRTTPPSPRRCCPCPDRPHTPRSARTLALAPVSTPRRTPGAPRSQVVRRVELRDGRPLLTCNRGCRAAAPTATRRPSESRGPTRPATRPRGPAGPRRVGAVWGALVAGRSLATGSRPGRGVAVPRTAGPSRRVVSPGCSGMLRYVRRIGSRRLRYRKNARTTIPAATTATTPTPRVVDRLRSGSCIGAPPYSLVGSR